MRKSCLYELMCKNKEHSDQATFVNTVWSRKDAICMPGK